MPSPHKTHTDEFDARASVLNVESGQGVHDLLRAVSAKKPAGHSVQDAAPGVEKKPAGQIVHASLVAEPTAKLAVPAPHKTHALSVWPGAALNVPCGHGLHVETDDAPALLLPVPMGQSEHRALPLVAE